jgi:hypothetical protein
MRSNPLSTVAAVATIAVVAFGVTACKSSSHASTPSPAHNPPATQIQPASASPQSTSASTLVSAAASTPASSVASASPAGSSSASLSVSAPVAAAAGAINACSLLTGAQASALTGRAFGPGVASVLTTGIDQCDYPYTGVGVDMRLIVYEPSSGLNNLASLEPQLNSEGTIMQVSGVGDKAEFAGLDLDVVTGKYVFDVEAASGTDLNAGVIAVAKEVVGALASK